MEATHEEPKVQTDELCPTCDKNPALEPHTCPYAEDIHDDSETLCTCCLDCIHECAMDI